MNSKGFIKFLDLVLIAQFVAAMGMLFINQSFIFFIFASFAMLSRIVYGFFEVNLDDAKPIKKTNKENWVSAPALIVFVVFFGWIFRVLLSAGEIAEAHTNGGVDEFFLKSPYLLVVLVFLIGVVTVAAGGIIRGYRHK